MQKHDGRLYYNEPDKTMFGKQISQERAQIILPMLIERVKRACEPQTISYPRTISFGELAEKFNMRFALPIKFPVCYITGTLYFLERNELPQAKFKWEHGKIPRIANMVTKAGGKPTDFVRDNLKYINEDFQQLLDRIYDYDHWNKVLEVLGLE